MNIEARFLASCRSRACIQKAILRFRKSGTYLTVVFDTGALLDGYGFLICFQDWLRTKWDRKARITSGGIGGGTFRIYRNFNE